MILLCDKMHSGKRSSRLILIYTYICVNFESNLLKSVKMDDVIELPRNHDCLSYNSNNYYIGRNL